MAKTYGTTVIPGDQITVRSGGTVQVSAAFERTAVLVGGMDTATGTATPGDLVEVPTVSDAEDLFGTDSELHEQSRLAFLNGLSNGGLELEAVPVTETTVTGESTGGAATGNLANAPIFAPSVNNEHTITFTDTTDGALTVNENYASPPPQPTDADTVNINPTTGEYAADAAATGDYEADYQHGDYTTALATAAAAETRYIGALSSNTSVLNDALTEANNNASNFVFQRVVANTLPDITPGSYTDALDDQRLVVVSPARGYVDDAETNEQRTSGAVTGYLASLPLGDSATYDSLSGLTGLRNDYTPTEAGSLVDEQVLPLIQDGVIRVVKDMTTSTDPRFERVYAVEIVDEATELSHLISIQFVGELNTEENRYRLESSHNTTYREMRDDNPPLLDDFTVSAVQNSANDNQVDVEIGLDVVNVMDTIDVTIIVGDVVSNGGAA